MSLKPLIKKQSLIIDDHRRGNKEIKDWDDEKADIHIDKSTNLKVEGKHQKIRLRIPINSNRPIKITNARNLRLDDIPTKLEKEIRNALENPQIRTDFIGDLLEVLKNFPTSLQSEERAQRILRNLSKHFNLEWTQEKIVTYANEALKSYTEIYQDEDGDEYYITIDQEKIKIAENNGTATLPKRIRK